MAVKASRPFLCNDYIIYNNHEPLKYLHMSAADSCISRTLDELYMYNFEIRHISGNENIFADALLRSQNPMEDLNNWNSSH